MVGPKMGRDHHLVIEKIDHMLGVKRDETPSDIFFKPD